MLTSDALIQCGDELRPIREIREDSSVSSASGWGEVAQGTVGDVFVQFDHKGPVLTITTQGGAKLCCSPGHSCFCRLNPLVRQYSLYLMERSSLGFRVGLSHDLMKELFAMQNLKLDLFNQDEIIDRLWLIETTENLQRASFLEKLLTYKYGLPNIPFSARHLDSDLSDKMIFELFNHIDTPSRAQQLLRDWFMFEDQPHITIKLTNKQTPKSSAIQFIIFGGGERSQRRTGFSHLIRIDGSVKLDHNEQKQFKRRMGNHGLWNLEVTREDLDEAQLFVKTLSCLDEELEVVKKIQLTKKAPFYVLPASHVKVGMMVPVLGTRGIEEDIVVNVELSEHDGPIYDLKVSDLHNYITGRWVVMNYNAIQAFPTNSTSPTSKGELL